MVLHALYIFMLFLEQLNICFPMPYLQGHVIFLRLYCLHIDFFHYVSVTNYQYPKVRKFQYLFNEVSNLLMSGFQVLLFLSILNPSSDYAVSTTTSAYINIFRILFPNMYSSFTDFISSIILFIIMLNSNGLKVHLCSLFPFRFSAHCYFIFTFIVFSVFPLQIKHDGTVIFFYSFN